MSKIEKKLKATHQGELSLNGFNLSSAVLDDGTRVLVSRSLATAFGIKGSGAYWQKKKTEENSALLPEYLSAKYLKPFISDDLMEILSKPIPYVNKQGVETEGISASVLADICDIYIKAGEKGALKNNKEIAENAYKILLAFSKVGIIALVDEVTGYQYDREKDELQKILKAYISPELLVWEKRFPDEFYREIFRLNNWDFTVSQIKYGQRPGIIGTWTKKYIYSVLPQGVLQALLKETPRNDQGKLTKKLHQKLTREQGIEHLNKQIVSAVTLMNVSDNWKDFEKLWNKKFGQQELPLQELNIIEPQKKLLSGFNEKLKQALNNNPKDKGDS